MKVRIKKQNQDGTVRLESQGTLKEILINEHVVDPDAESISICYRGRNSSGIIDLSPAEIEMVYEAIQKQLHLLKGFRRLTSSGALILK